MYHYLKQKLESEARCHRVHVVTMVNAVSVGSSKTWIGQWGLIAAFSNTILIGTTGYFDVLSWKMLPVVSLAYFMVSTTRSYQFPNQLVEWIRRW